MYLIQLRVNRNNYDGIRRSKEVFSTILPNFAEAKAICEGEYDREYQDEDRIWSIKRLGSGELIQVSDDPVLYEIHYPEKVLLEIRKSAITE